MLDPRCRRVARRTVCIGIPSSGPEDGRRPGGVLMRGGLMLVVPSGGGAYSVGGCEDARSGGATGAYAGGAIEVIAQAGAGGGAGTAVTDASGQLTTS